MEQPSYLEVYTSHCALTEINLPEYPDILAIMRTLFASLAVSLLVVVCGAQTALPMATQLPDSPPKMDLVDLKGGHHTLDEYKGKAVIVNFWATYCVPCATEMPMLGQMQKHYKNKIIVLAVSVDDELDRAKLQPFLHKHQADDLTLLVGPSVIDLSDWKMGDSLPATLFIDAEGKVAGKVAGALKRPDLEKRLSEMTGIPAEKPAKKVAHKKSSEN
jgi:thiol-disulfide isomerase/thioredoxin